MFVLMWFAPLIFLTKYGRKYIGITKPRSVVRLLYSFIIGAVFCGLLFGIFHLLYGNGIENCFAYISRSYTLPHDILETNKLTYFLIFSAVGITFSPIGEELLYRGVIHGSFVGRFGEQKASVFDSLAFGLTHLAHFGIVYSAGVWDFLPVPALLWVVSMFVAGQLFFRSKQMCNSILGAIVCHAGFNVAMMYFIFYHIF